MCFLLFSDNDPPVLGLPEVCENFSTKTYYPDAPITFCHKFLLEESRMQNRPMRSFEERSKVRYVMNDRLSTSSINGAGGRSCPWIKKIEEWDIKVLVLNRGAHFVQNDIFERELRHTLGVVKKKNPHVTVIYRNTPAGPASHPHPHPMCYCYRTCNCYCCCNIDIAIAIAIAVAIAIAIVVCDSLD